jgi:hypothetical protein
MPEMPLWERGDKDVTWDRMAKNKKKGMEGNIRIRG